MVEQKNQRHNTVGAWTKRCYFAGRAVMEAVLRPYGLGSTQWYVLYQLACDGPTRQRDLVELLQIERGTMSGLVVTLMRKNLVEQVQNKADQRQKYLSLTKEGAKLWNELPDLAFIHSEAFDGISKEDIATTCKVLQTATERLENLLINRGVNK